jgi:hypothetical protein
MVIAGASQPSLGDISSLAGVMPSINKLLTTPLMETAVASQTTLGDISALAGVMLL